MPIWSRSCKISGVHLLANIDEADSIAEAQLTLCNSHHEITTTTPAAMDQPS
jgi:hypothetical protein